MSQVFGHILNSQGNSEPTPGLPLGANPFAAAQNYSSSSLSGQTGSLGFGKASAEAKRQDELAVDKSQQDDLVTHEIVPENEEKKQRLLKAGASLKASQVMNHRVRASTVLLDKLKTQQSQAKGAKPQ
jgi:hypothetical protein